MTDTVLAGSRLTLLGACLIAAGFVLLALAWAGANPPGASPDENAHVVKAYATADGQLEGEPYGADTTEMDPLSGAWFDAVGRSYLLPRAIVPPASIRCYAFDRNLTADCQQFSPDTADRTPVLTPTHFGTYSPVLYVPLGIVMRGATDYRAAEWRGRLAATFISGLFVFWAALLLAGRGQGWLPLAGLAVATTPAVVFLAASVTTSGIEIASAICFWAAMLMLARERESAGGPWAAAALSGGVLALSRPLDAIILVVAVVTIIVLVGWQNAWVRVRAEPSKAALAGCTIGLCVGVSAFWSVFVTPHPSIDGGLALRSIDDALRDAPNQLRQVIGVFGWNDTPMPQVFYILGLGMMAVLVCSAFIVGSRRERLAMTALTVGTVGIHLGLAVFVEAQIGFGMQARYVLPLVVGLVLTAADTLEEHRPELPSTAVTYAVPMAFSGAALIQIVAFTANVHRYVVGGNASWQPPWDSSWMPDGGFGEWFGLASAGALCILLAGVAAVVAARHAQVMEPPTAGG